MEAVSQIALFYEPQSPAGRELLLPTEEQRHQFTADVVARNQERDLALVATQKERGRGEFRSLVWLVSDQLREALGNDELLSGQLPVALGGEVDKSPALRGSGRWAGAGWHEVDLYALSGNCPRFPGNY